jgi:hypothetical protein
MCGFIAMFFFFSQIRKKWSWSEQGKKTLGTLGLQNDMLHAKFTSNIISSSQIYETLEFVAFVLWMFHCFVDLMLGGFDNIFSIITKFSDN